MKKTLINEVRKFQKIAGILKEYIEDNPQTIAEAFEEAGIELSQPVVYIVDAGRGAVDEPVTMLGSELLKKLEAKRAEGGESVNYDLEPGEVDPDLQPEEVRDLTPKLYIEFSDSVLYEIYQ